MLPSPSSASADRNHHTGYSDNNPQSTGSSYLLPRNHINNSNNSHMNHSKAANATADKKPSSTLKKKVKNDASVGIIDESELSHIKDIYSQLKTHIKTPQSSHINPNNHTNDSLLSYTLNHSHSVRPHTTPHTMTLPTRSSQVSKTTKHKQMTPAELYRQLTLPSTHRTVRTSKSSLPHYASALTSVNVSVASKGNNKHQSTTPISLVRRANSFPSSVPSRKNHKNSAVTTSSTAATTGSSSSIKKIKGQSSAQTKRNKLIRTHSAGDKIPVINPRKKKINHIQHEPLYMHDVHTNTDDNNNDMDELSLRKQVNGFENEYQKYTDHNNRLSEPISNNNAANISQTSNFSLDEYSTFPPSMDHLQQQKHGQTINNNNRPSTASAALSGYSRNQPFHSNTHGITATIIDTNTNMEPSSTHTTGNRSRLPPRPPSRGTAHSFYL